MARHYSPRAFMIEAPNRLIKEYYERQGLDGDIPWQHLSEKDIDFVFKAYENAPEPVRRRMDNDFRSVHNLADEGGIKTLIDVGQSQFHDVDFVSVFDAVSALIYDEEHVLSKQTQRPAFEVIFVYSESEYSLDIRADGPKETLIELQILWGRAILECELGDPPADSIVYRLDALRNEDFQFVLEPEDGVSEVRVKRLKLKVMGSYHRITLEVPARRDPKEVYGLLERVVKGLGVSDDLLRVVSAGIQLVFPGVGTRREEKLTFNVSRPNSCSLRCELKHEIAKSLLKRWGLDVSGDSEDDPDEPGQPAQRIIHA